MLPHTVPFVSPPFRLSALPQEGFAHASWRRAEQTALGGLEAGDCVLLLGAPGTGKTLLLQALANLLRGRGHSVHLVVAGEVPAETRPRDVLLVDDADKLSPAALDALCGMVNPMVLAGLPVLHERFARSDEQKIGVATLEALSPEEVARFVVGRLSATGRKLSMFGPEAVYALVVHSSGVFRVLTILASASLFFAELRRASEVTAADVEEAAGMRLGVVVGSPEGEERLAGAPAVRAHRPKPRWPHRSWLAVPAIAGVRS